LTCLFMRLIKFAAILFLAGCNPYNHYSSPCVEVPAQWKGEVATESEEEPQCEWWVVFDDPVLNCLEEKAVVQNRDLEQAWYAFKEAAALSRVALSELFPQITFNPSYQRVNQLVNTSFEGIPGLPAGPLRMDQKSYTLPLNGQYEVDLWNQLGLNARAARLTAHARCWALRALRLTITAEVAQNYFAIRTLDSELAVLKRSIQSRSDQVHITNVRYEGGLITYTDVSRAATELAIAQADYEDVYRSRLNFINALAVLIGEPASCFDLDFTELQQDLPKIPAYLPSEVAFLRPDIREAERLVAAAHADIGVAWASFLPSFTLQGTIGYSSPMASNLLSWQARLWGYAYNISQIVFDGGGVWYNFQAAKDAYFQNVAAYQQSVLIAFQEVEDALANIEYRYRQEQYLKEAVRASTETLDLTNIRYDKGVIDYLDVVDAERTSLDSQRTEVRTRGAQFLATVELIKALGGGWLDTSDSMLSDTELQNQCAVLQGE